MAAMLAISILAVIGPFWRQAIVVQASTPSPAAAAPAPASGAPAPLGGFGMGGFKPIVYSSDGLTATLRSSAPPPGSRFAATETIARTADPNSILLSLETAGVPQADGTMLWTTLQNGQIVGTKTTVALAADCPCGYVSVAGAAVSAVVCGISLGFGCGAAIGASVAAYEQCNSACSAPGAVDNPPTCTTSAVLTLQRASNYGYMGNSQDSIDCQVAPSGIEISATLTISLNCNSGCTGGWGPGDGGYCYYGNAARNGGVNHKCSLTNNYACGSAGNCYPVCETESETWDVLYTAVDDPDTHHQYFYGQSNQSCN